MLVTTILHAGAKAMDKIGNVLLIELWFRGERQATDVYTFRVMT